MQELISNLGKWSYILKDETSKPYFSDLARLIDNEYRNKTIFPPYNDIFRALRLTDYDEVKIVILGQDPYHEKGQATGLAFSVNEGVRLPPSLRNIYKEIAAEYNTEIDTNGDLTYLAKQGVLLLNSCLTVEEGRANSHKSCGWETFSDRVIRETAKKEDVVFLLWGSDALKKQTYLQNNYVLTAAHPSPLSAYRGFLGCGHFKKANEILLSLGKTEICWTRKND